MFSNLLNRFWISIVFIAIQTQCNSIKRESLVDPRAINIRQWIAKQWNQWPPGQWTQGQWPSAAWNQDQWQTQWNITHWPTAQWNSSQWSPGVQWQRPSTGKQEWTTSKYSTPLTSTWWPTRVTVNKNPTTPDWANTPKPSSIWPVNETPNTEWATAPTVTTSSTQRTTTTQKWTTASRPTTAPTTQSNDSFSMTVKTCGLSHIPQVFISNKIVSGKVAKNGEFPWQVILKIHTARGPMQCGGAILNSRWILTAAHCVSNERNGQPTAQRIDVTAGVINRLVAGTGSQVRTADCVIQHEGWSGQIGKFKHDVALIRLDANNPIDMNYEQGGHVNGICLPPTPMSEFSGRGRIAGWGLTKDKGSPSDVLMYTDVSILDNEKCKLYPYPVPIADSMMCQGVDRKAPCQGDSGGALIISMADKRGIQRMTEIGIVSFGPGECANAKTPNAIYTKVSHYLKWLEKTVKANSGAKCAARTLKNDKTEKIDGISGETQANNETNEAPNRQSTYDSTIF